MNDPSTKPGRWLRFNLQTLFVLVTLFALPLGFVGYNLNWIRQRQAFIATHVRPVVYLPQSSTGKVWNCCIIWEVDAPWSIRLFGAEGKHDWETGKMNRQEIEEGKRLFPESNWGKEKPQVVTAMELRPLT